MKKTIEQRLVLIARKTVEAQQNAEQEAKIEAQRREAERYR